MNTTSKVAVGLVALVLVGSWLPDDDAQEPRVAAPRPSASAAASEPADPAPQAAASPADGVVEALPAEPPAPADEPDLLQAAPGGDGDSWKDTRGREYRLGMVNAPEVGECYGDRATAERKRLTARGFRADAYADDRYGRSVSVVTSADGTNINVHLARHGFADDRYLEQFRHENPSLAAALDDAFTAAKAERSGLWGACDAAPKALAAPPPAAAAPASRGDCHGDYLTCIPVKGDGSGRGQVNDLDCGDIGQAVQLRQAVVDPYRLDADGDGWGCDS